MNPLLLTDFYKVHHHVQYPEGMTLLYSNMTPRRSRMKGVDAVVVFGIQHFCLEYLVKRFNQDFFYANIDIILEEYHRHVPATDAHIRALHKLGYLPIEIKALDEGTLCPIGVPLLTIQNTHPDFAWLTNYLETLMSAMLWQPITSATIAHEYYKLLSKYAIETTGTDDFVQWQGHDFSMRGMSSVESAILSGMGHLVSFTGTDTIPAIYQLEKSYFAGGLIGASVPATEHSVMCMGMKESEIDTFKRLLSLYPTGILSVVSDTWDLWKVCTEYLPLLKDEVMNRNGKLVIRPDSGDPVDILCGKGIQYTEYDKALPHPSDKGVIELLWDVFGGTVNEQGYKVLNPCIGAIYGDSITLERAEQICERLKAKGFASTNVVLGIGSYTYQYNTRDTFGFAVKATYGEVTNLKEFDNISSNPAEIIPASAYIKECREIFKDPITDDGTKKSKKGLLTVIKARVRHFPGEEITVVDQVSWQEENEGLLTTVFKDGRMVKIVNLSEIRERIRNGSVLV
jgi:nicotinamide phosphoribosyltransferase